MRNQSSIDAIAARPNTPLYGSYCFTGLPQLTRSVLTGDRDLGLPAPVLGDLPRRARSVVVFLVDGFGWSTFERFSTEPFLRRVLDEGVASKLTSQFPSTTAAHVTTWHTGVPACESGVFEWVYYEPLLDEIFAPFRSPIDRSELFPVHTLYEELAARGVRSYVHQPAIYASSPYTAAVTRGAQPRPYRARTELLVNLARDVTAATEPTYHAVYLDPVDSLSHTYGPDSPQLAAEVRALFRDVEDCFATELAGDVLVLVTADHGHTAVDPARTIYLDDLLPEAVHWMKTTRDGRPLVPAGSARDMFLYIRDEHVDSARSAIAAALGDRAVVHRARDLVRSGLFGPTPSARLIERIGDLVILPAAHEMVWWRGDGRFEQHKRGHHGGLTADELEIPLLAWAP